MRGYPRSFPGILIAVMAGLFLTGFLLVPTSLEMRMEQAMSWRLSGDGRLVTTAAHSALAFLMLIFLGALSVIHMRIGWRQLRNRRSGLGMVAGMLGLMISSLVILYSGDEWRSLVAALTHILLGGVVFGVFAYHAVVGYGLRKSCRKSNSLSQATPQSHNLGITISRPGKLITSNQDP